MTGLFYEDLHVDAVFTHSIRRTVTETDNILFTTLTHNTQPLHLDEEHATSTPLGTRVVNSVFTIGLIGA
jgi:acyl dehydratase